MSADVRWMTAMLDSPPESTDASEAFWLGVTGARLSPSRGRRHEFASLLPRDGDATLKVQRVVQSSPGAMHLDLHSDDVPGLAERVELLGGSTSYHVLGYVICGSPGGLSFCVVGHPGRRIPSPVAWPGGRSLVDQVCLDIPPHAYDDEVAFWRALTGWELVDCGARELGRLRRPGSAPFALLLQRLADEQSTTTVHLDLSCDDREAETSRHLALGAEVLDVRTGWTVLHDPAGRSYCITGRRPGDV